MPTLKQQRRGCGRRQEVWALRLRTSATFGVFEGWSFVRRLLEVLFVASAKNEDVIA